MPLYEDEFCPTRGLASIPDPMVEEILLSLFTKRREIESS